MQPGLEHFQASNSFAGQLLPMCHPPQLKKNQKTTLSLYPVKSILFHFKTVSPCPVTTVPGKTVFLISPLYSLKDLIASSTGGTAPALSAFFSQHRYSNAVFMTFLWTYSNRSMSFLCWHAGLQVGFDKSKVEGEIHLPCQSPRLQACTDPQSFSSPGCSSSMPTLKALPQPASWRTIPLCLQARRKPVSRSCVVG